MTALLSLALAVAAPADPDVVVYGGTPAGVAAAVEAGKAGLRVLLVEPYRWVGGLVSNGLSHPDFRTFEGLTGFYLDLTRRTHAYYADKYGPDSQQAKDCFRGTHAEPHVNRLVFERMLAEQKAVTVRVRTRLTKVETAGRRVTAATFAGPDGVPLRVAGAVFIDATYEGDLMAAAGAKYRVGREGRAEYGESLAPAEADGQVQGYNFRLCMTAVPANRLPAPEPPGYRRDDFAPVLALFADGRIKSVFGTKDAVYKTQIPLPNGKEDINDVSHSAVRLSLPDVSPRWPDGSRAEREVVFAEHVRHNLGLLHFLQTDPAVPEKVRAEANQWGLCKDEFAETGHVPDQLYVREARRGVGRYTYTEADTDYAPADARGKFHQDSVAMGDYGENCHGTGHAGPRVGGRHTGEFYKPVPPYQVPYGVIVPKDFDNLLVPVAASASHVGFCALRLEPVWSALGQAAGVAAGLAVRGKTSVPDVPVGEIQRRLHAAGAATMYVSDVRPGSPDFAAVQWWAARGGLHGLNPPPAKPGDRGKHLVGQYYEAYPGHAADLDKPLDAAVRAKWLALAKEVNAPAGVLEKAATRGEFVRAAYRAANP
jgi:hypothetical protein